jgi:hypothetical protein
MHSFMINPYYPLGQYMNVPPTLGEKSFKSMTQGQTLEVMEKIHADLNNGMYLYQGITIQRCKLFSDAERLEEHHSFFLDLDIKTAHTVWNIGLAYNNTVNNRGAIAGLFLSHANCNHYVDDKYYPTNVEETLCMLKEIMQGLVDTPEPPEPSKDKMEFLQSLADAASPSLVGNDARFSELVEHGPFSEPEAVEEEICPDDSHTILYSWD